MNITKANENNKLCIKFDTYYKQERYFVGDGLLIEPYLNESNIKYTSKELDTALAPYMNTNVVIKEDCKVYSKSGTYLGVYYI